ncbi:MAG: PTS transporter subunit EIIC [Collinsella stercoris]|nr:PTS transporter subunit EIIC [Collinsella stercoris]
MSKLDKMFESPFFVKLQEWGGKVQSNKVISAISNGMMSIMSLVIAGAAFMILATLLDIAGVLETTDQVYHWLCVPYNMTMGLISLPIAFAVGYSYSKNLGMKGALANGLVTMVLFLMVAAPVQSVDVNGSATNMIPTSFLGGPGIFVAMFLPIISVRIIKFCKDKNATIKMPDSIPPYLVDSFANIIPLVICLILWQGLSVLCQVAMGGATLPALIMGILGIPLSGLTSIPGMFVLLAISMLCWGLGLHGQGIVSVVTLPAMMAAYGTNAELVAAGQATEFAPIFLFMSATAAGGAGNMLSLAACCLRAKSERLRAVGKAGVVPAIFNISEPMIFGTPVMYNPIIAIPMVLNSLLCMGLIYVGFAVGFFQNPYILMLTPLPVGLATFLSSMAWQNIFIPVLCFVVGVVCFWPFVRMYDKQCLADEQAANEQAAA